MVHELEPHSVLTAQDSVSPSLSAPPLLALCLCLCLCLSPSLPKINKNLKKKGRKAGRKGERERERERKKEKRKKEKEGRKEEKPRKQIRAMFQSGPYFTLSMHSWVCYSPSGDVHVLPELALAMLRPRAFLFVTQCLSAE